MTSGFVKARQLNLKLSPLRSSAVEHIERLPTSLTRSEQKRAEKIQSIPQFTKLTTNTRLNLETHPPHLWELLGVAFLEEILYRYYWISNHFHLGGVFVSCLVFGMSHIFFGWSQVVSKTLLGFICALSVLYTHSLALALIIHVGFNGWVWRSWHIRMREI